jgi:hypothetical protein
MGGGNELENMCAADDDALLSGGTTIGRQSPGLLISDSPLQCRIGGPQEEARTLILRFLPLLESTSTNRERELREALALVWDPDIRPHLMGTDVLQELYGIVVVMIAESYLTVREGVGKDGRANNTGPEVEAFQKGVGIAKGASWCAAFAYWCHAEASRLMGGSTTAPRTGAASYIWYQGKKGSHRFTVGDVRAGKAAPRAGDLFVFEEVLDTTAGVRKRFADAKSKADGLRTARLKELASKRLPPDQQKAGEMEIQKQYEEEIRKAEQARDEAIKAMPEGVKLGDRLAKDSGEFFPSHTGIVKSYDRRSGLLVTIEGNTSSGAVGSREGDGVYQRNDRMEQDRKGNRKYAQLYGFVRPALLITG